MCDSTPTKDFTKIEICNERDFDIWFNYIQTKSSVKVKYGDINGCLTAVVIDEICPLGNKKQTPTIRITNIDKNLIGKKITDINKKTLVHNSKILLEVIKPTNGGAKKQKRKKISKKKISKKKKSKKKKSKKKNNTLILF